ncbi:hypothetical protein F5Y09DRAFT_317255 [Xylaria sp. FL1042]|nr:hypothetical protein F5Y09DRAFT_317255 [Xylaria sp. FL1042]
MESTRTATRSVRSEPTPRTMGYATESTPTPGTDAEGGDGYGTSSAYLLKWTDTEIARTIIHSAAQLTSCIQEHSNSSRQLLVFHGLPVDLGVALKEAIDIDASFIEAHAGRRSYRPQKAKVKAAWAHYDYPELVYRSTVCNDGQQRTTSRDLVGEPPTYTASATGDSIMLCRASIWLSEKAQILFLDRAPWEDPNSEVSRGRYKAYAAEGMPDENGVSMVAMQIDPDGNVTALGDEIPSLETMLYENLRDTCSGHEDLLELLEELVLAKWDDFFEVLSVNLPVGSTETTALLSQALGCLERNLDVSRRWYKTRRRPVDAPLETQALLDAKPQPTTTEWEALLSRLSRRAQLLSHLTPTLAVPSNYKASAQTNGDAGFGVLATGGYGGKCDCKSKKNNNSGSNYYNSNGTPSTPGENQRALNRVAYLGGVLLPFSVVSGILAIEEPYGPGGSQFWIFWAVTVPLTLVTLGVIYADSIRKVQVWVEVTAAASGKSNSSGSDTDSVVSGRLPQQQQQQQQQRRTDVEQAVPRMSRFAEPRTFVEFVDVGDVASEHEGGEGAETDEGEEGEEEGEPEPDMIVEKRWKNTPDAGEDEGQWARKKKKKMKWRKEELGWVGACATLFQVYKLKKGVPPKHLRHRDSRNGLPRRGRTN